MKIDMWQAGVTLCYLLTGDYPFSLHNIAECLQQMRENRPNVSGVYNANIREMLQQLLQCDPSLRPSASYLLGQ